MAGGASLVFFLVLHVFLAFLLLFLVPFSFLLPQVKLELRPYRELRASRAVLEQAFDQPTPGALVVRVVLGASIMIS